jgi:ribonuclease P protein component
MAKITPFSGEAAFSAHRRRAKKFETKFFSALVAPAEDSVARFSVVASKARIGGAVERNRAKRRLRAAFDKVINELNKDRKKIPAASASIGVILYAKAPVLEAEFTLLIESLREGLKNALVSY